MTKSKKKKNKIEIKQTKNNGADFFLEKINFRLLSETAQFESPKWGVILTKKKALGVL